MVSGKQSQNVESGFVLDILSRPRKRPMVVLEVKYHLSHTLYCAKGWHTHMSYNKIHDTFAMVMHNFC